MNWIAWCTLEEDIEHLAVTAINTTNIDVKALSTILARPLNARQSTKGHFVIPYLRAPTQNKRPNTKPKLHSEIALQQFWKHLFLSATRKKSSINTEKWWHRRIGYANLKEEIKIMPYDDAAENHEFQRISLCTHNAPMSLVHHRLWFLTTERQRESERKTECAIQINRWKQQ